MLRGDFDVGYISAHISIFVIVMTSVHIYSLECEYMKYKGLKFTVVKISVLV